MVSLRGVCIAQFAFLLLPYTMFNKLLVSRENEVDMLQKIFGESEDEEEGEESEMRDRPVTPTKTRAPGKKMREEMSQPTTTAPPSPPPTDDVLRPLTPPPEPLAPPTQAPPKEEPKRPMFKPRGEREEERSVREAREEPMDKEDIAMLRLALGRLREEGVGLVGGVNWAYHPNDILSFPISVCTFMFPSLGLCAFLTPPTFNWSPAPQAETARLAGSVGPRDRLRKIRGLLQNRCQR